MLEISSSDPVPSTFEQLVSHYEAVDSQTRAELARSFDVDDPSPNTLASTWFDRPDELAELLIEMAGDANCAPAVTELALEHSLPLEPTWFEPGVRVPLSNLGLLPELTNEDTFVFPAGLAAALAPYVQGRRPSLAILLGRADDERIDQLLNVYELDATGSRLERIAPIIDALRAPDALDAIVERLPSPEWLGPALMILELGGTCYWREIFGIDAEGQGGDQKVVAMMGAEQRDQEREVADTLIELGAIFRLDADDRPWPMIAVPEELWPPIWAQGRDWVADWLQVTHQHLDESAADSIGSTKNRDAVDFQQATKWLVCETTTEPLEIVEEQPSDSTANRLDKHASPELQDVWPRVWDLAIEASILEPDDDRTLQVGRDAESLLQASAQNVSSSLLHEWCAGYLGKHADENLNQAIGVDETWRQQALELLRARHEFIPHWFEYQGTDQEHTGSGCLRSLEDDQMELTLQEFGILNGLVWMAKLLWLDLLSLLDHDRTYLESQLADLLRLSAAMSAYTRIGDLMHDSRAYFYLPIQRPSLLNSPMHLEECDAWASDIFENLLEPLGLVQVGDTVETTEYQQNQRQDQPQRHTEDRRISLSEPIPVIDGPAGWPDDGRKRMIQLILGDDVEWDVDSNPTARGHHLSAVEPATDTGNGERIDLAADLQHLLEQVEGRSVRACDGESILLDD